MSDSVKLLPFWAGSRLRLPLSVTRSSAGLQCRGRGGGRRSGAACCARSGRRLGRAARSRGRARDARSGGRAMPLAWRPAWGRCQRAVGLALDGAGRRRRAGHRPAAAAARGRPLPGQGRHGRQAPAIVERQDDERPAAEPVRPGWLRPHRMEHATHGGEPRQLRTGDRGRHAEGISAARPDVAGRRGTAGCMTPRATTGLDGGRRMLTWYAEQARDLPWRRPDASPWEVDGQRVHAAADPGGAGAWAVAELGGALAHPAGAGRGAGRGGGPGLGPAGLSASRPAAAPRRRWHHRASRRRGAQRPRRPAGPAGRRLLHGGGDRRASRTGNGTSCWTPTSAGCWPGLRSGEAHPPAAATAPRRGGPTVPAGRAGRAARWAVASMELGPWSARPGRRAASAAPSRDRAPGTAPGRPSGRAAAAAPDVRGNRPAVPGRAAGRASLEPTCRSPAPSWTPAWPDPINGTGLWRRWSPTGWWSATTTAGTPCPV